LIYNLLQWHSDLDRTATARFLERLQRRDTALSSKSLAGNSHASIGANLASAYLRLHLWRVPARDFHSDHPNWKAALFCPNSDLGHPPQRPTPRCTTQSNPEGTLGGQRASSRRTKPPGQRRRSRWHEQHHQVGEQSDFGIDATARQCPGHRFSVGHYGALIGMGNTGGQNLTTIDPTVPGTVSAYKLHHRSPFQSLEDPSYRGTPNKHSQITTVARLVAFRLSREDSPIAIAPQEHNGKFNRFIRRREVSRRSSAHLLLDTMDFRVCLYLVVRDDHAAMSLSQ